MLAEDQLITGASGVRGSDDVARYYDRNTRRFLSLGGSGAAAAIHRKIWAPGVENTSEAFLYLNKLVAELIGPALPAGKPRRLLDLGCGVGGTATWLSQQLDAVVTGVTNSPTQAAIARQRAAGLELAERTRFIEGDFHNLPRMEPFEAAYAIEAFIHAREAELFFQQAAASIQRGGRLVICDDFCGESESTEAKAWRRRFQNGWHAITLIRPEEAIDIARIAGFRLVKDIDLTAYLRQYPPYLLWALTLLTRLPLYSSYWENLAGGSALQVCVKNGWTRYMALTWEKV